MADRRVAVLVVSLCDVEPRIWRRFRVPVAIRLDRLHWAIQAVMGWEGSHEFEFEIGGVRYGVETESSPSGPLPVTGAQKVALAKLKPRLGEVFRYVYDMGDHWEHDVVLEALDWEESNEFVCADGANACPPEDGGGASTYAAALHARGVTGNGKHRPEEEVASGLIDSDFDPRRFSVAAATHALRLMASAGVFGEYA